MRTSFSKWQWAFLEGKTMPRSTALTKIRITAMAWPWQWWWVHEFRHGDLTSTDPNVSCNKLTISTQSHGCDSCVIFRVISIMTSTWQPASVIGLERALCSFWQRSKASLVVLLLQRCKHQGIRSDVTPLFLRRETYGQFTEVFLACLRNKIQHTETWFRRSEVARMFGSSSF